MTLLQYFLLIILSLFTLFNIYALTIGKKKKKQSVANYKQILANLENKAFSEMKKRQLKFTEKHGYITDNSQGILLTFDHEKQKMGITLKDSFYLIPYSDVVSCKESHRVLDNGKWTDFTVELETGEQVITLLFGSHAWKPKSTLANFILTDTKEFCSLVNRYCKEGIEVPTTEKA